MEEEVWNSELGDIFGTSEDQVWARSPRQCHLSVILALERLFGHLLQESDGLCDSLLCLGEGGLVILPGDILNAANADGKSFASVADSF